MSSQTIYAIVDIETTGQRVREDRITEVAIFIHDGNKVIEEFNTLINPEKYIPSFITQLTGIDNEMVKDAPKFYEVAKKIVEMTEGRVLVGHNVYFDYTFLKAEFRNLGFRYSRKTLCTLRLSRKILPKMNGYGLAKLSNSLGLDLENHHRARADAYATVQLFEILLEKNESKAEKNIIDDSITLKTLPPKINIEDFENLPEETGVYYFFNEEGRVIYIGKSKNIKKRIATHFSTNLNNRKTIEFKKQIDHIRYTLTGSELIALLLESDEIKAKQPLFNRAQRRTRSNYGIYERKSRKGYLTFFVDKLKNQTKVPLKVTNTLPSARGILYNLAQEHNLCLKLCNLYKTDYACFDYQVKQCLGACIEEESAEEYNIRANEVRNKLSDNALRSMFIISRGRNPAEKSVVCVEKGKYLGFGYLGKEIPLKNLEEAKEHIENYADNRDVQKIIRAWLKGNKGTVIFCD